MQVFFILSYGKTQIIAYCLKRRSVKKLFPAAKPHYIDESFDINILDKKSFDSSGKNGNLLPL